MKVSELFEAPDDKSFITMMNQILGDIPELKQKKTEFEKKIGDIATSIPGLIRKQADLEKWMRAASEAVQRIPNTMMARFLPELKGLEKEYQEGVSILDMLSFHLPYSFEHQRKKAGGRPSRNDNDDEWTPICMEFVKNHGDDIEDCIRAVDHGFQSIRNLADQEKWPLDWRKTGSITSDTHMFKNMQEELLYWVKELNTVKEDGDAGVDASNGMAIPNKKWKKILFKKVPPSMNPYKKSK